jgi:hypothetical protein
MLFSPEGEGCFYSTRMMKKPGFLPTETGFLAHNTILIPLNVDLILGAFFSTLAEWFITWIINDKILAESEFGDCRML